MRRGFYYSLACDGMKKNKKMYLPYILTCTGMVMMLYVILYLATSGMLENVRGGLGRAGAGETKDPHSAGSGRGGDGCNEFGHGLALLFDPFEK